MTTPRRVDWQAGRQHSPNKGTFPGDIAQRRMLAYYAVGSRFNLLYHKHFSGVRELAGSVVEIGGGIFF